MDETITKSGTTVTRSVTSVERHRDSIIVVRLKGLQMNVVVMW